MKAALSALLGVFLRLLSYLPLWLICAKTQLFGGLFFDLFGYRKHVIYQNIRNSFPEKQEQEIQAIIRQYKSWFVRMLAENIKMLTISKQALLKRITISDVSELDQFEQNGKSVVAILGHYGNWEWLGLAAPMLFQHMVVNIFQASKNPFFDAQLNAWRSRFGATLVETRRAATYFQKQKTPTISAFIADQAPANLKRSPWISFLGREVPVHIGPALFAKKFNQIPVYFSITETKPGYYYVSFKIFPNDPQKSSLAEITKWHVTLLEEDIKSKPYQWLWSHNRWKRKKPENAKIIG